MNDTQETMLREAVQKMIQEELETRTSETVGDALEEAEDELEDTLEEIDRACNALPAQMDGVGKQIRNDVAVPVQQALSALKKHREKL